MTVLTCSSVEVFACYSAACRPPGSGGTGGSLKGGAHDAPISETAKASMRALKGEADALADYVKTAWSPLQFDSLEADVTRFGLKVHAALESVLETDADLVKYTEEHRRHMDDYRRLLDESSALFDQAKAAGSAYERERRELTSEEKAEVDRLHNLSLRASYTANQHWDAAEKARKSITERRASVIGQALNEIVPMGGEIAGVPAHKPRTDKWGNTGLTVHDQMTFAAKVYPRSWIERSNDFATEPHDNVMGSDVNAAFKIRPLVFRKSADRAHYLNGKIATNTVKDKYRGKSVELTESTSLTVNTANGRIKATKAYAGVYDYDEITLDDNIGTGVHEYAHRVEHMFPAVARMERAFIERRAGTLTTKKLGKGYKSDEVHLPDNLFDAYAEKVYEDGSNEVLSMGWEYYVTGRTKSNDPSSGRPNRPDPEHMGLILGMMTTVRRSTNKRKMTRQ